MNRLVSLSALVIAVGFGMGACGDDSDDDGDGSDRAGSAGRSGSSSAGKGGQTASEGGASGSAGETSLAQGGASGAAGQSSSQAGSGHAGDSATGGTSSVDCDEVPECLKNFAQAVDRCEPSGSCTLGVGQGETQTYALCYGNGVKVQYSLDGSGGASGFAYSIKDASGLCYSVEIDASDTENPETTLTTGDGDTITYSATEDGVTTVNCNGETYTYSEESCPTPDEVEEAPAEPPDYQACGFGQCTF